MYIIRISLCIVLDYSVFKIVLVDCTYCYVQLIYTIFTC